eukprot:TRINITY_DN1751_c0_g1_i2.p1 TRINITY_DN1751_c0_g1~~TRINITY_DN1751_c0_g1_i2.p1  ORF type:complete len:112 (+),score=10.16 TRINITY_DN1751_c0_g1_i2:53-388(+)
MCIRDRQSTGEPKKRSMQTATQSLLVCRGYASTGICPQSGFCIYSHPPVIVDVFVEMEGKMLPRESVGSKGLCAYWVSAGHCPIGDRCRFNHPPLIISKAAGQTSHLFDED